MQEGVLVADTKDLALRRFPSGESSSVASGKGQRAALPRTGRKVPAKKVAIFTRQFSV